MTRKICSFVLIFSMLTLLLPGYASGTEVYAADSISLTSGIFNTHQPEKKDTAAQQTLKILAVGDSICSGFRNAGKGFVGDLGLPYVNKGIAETTLSNSGKLLEYQYKTIGGQQRDRTPIPDKLALTKSNELPDYYPDILIANGGINDYFHNVRLGTIPIAPVTDEAALNELDAATVMGGLQRLLFYMKTLYPKAKSYFLITHRTFSAYPNSTYNYLPTTKNAAGYTQQDLHDALLTCCKVYDIEVIDVYKDSFLDSGLSQFRSDLRYADDPTVTDRDYIDYDGVHPFSRGYIEGYLPLIRSHLDSSFPDEITNPAITRQPEDQTAAVGRPLTISLEAEGEDLSYQWFYKKSCANTWSKWTNRTHASETVTPDASWNGIQLFCIVTDAAGASVSSNAITVSVIKSFRILAAGDSICAGARNGGKGFVGDLGLPYKNIGISGATLSTQNTAVKNIPDRFLEFYQFHSQSVDPQNDGWEPDIIIVNGGHNDYGYNAPLGDIPEKVASDINEADASTAMGGLERLLFLMTEKYPDARKYFLTTHKMYRNAPSEPEKNGYLPTKANQQGYNEQELHDAIVACCHVYNVEVIDVFTDSSIDSFSEEYRGLYYYNKAFSSDPCYKPISEAIDNTTEYFDKDGVHPLNRGYREIYVPLIKAHIDLYQPVDPPVLQITRQPESQTVELGNSITLSVQAEGIGLRYQWYYKKVGQESFSPYRTGATETVTPTASWNGIQLYCVVTDATGSSVTSDTVTVNVTQELKITQQPESVTVALGEAITLALKAQGIDLRYQWYFKKAGQTSFQIWKGHTNAKEGVIPPASWNGIQLYCVVTDATGSSVTSDTVTVNVTQELKITQQPESMTVALGEPITLALAAEGIDLRYQWYFKKAGQTSFQIWKGHTNAKEGVIPPASWNGIRLYCVVTDCTGSSVTSDTVTVNVTQELKITQQPESQTVALGETITLSLKAQGMGLRYQWYFKKAGQDSFQIWKGHTNAKEGVTPPASWNGIQLYCEVTDSAGIKANSGVATITVK